VQKPFFSVISGWVVFWSLLKGIPFSEIWVAGWRRLSDRWASSNFQFGFPFKRHLFQIVSSSQMLIACIDVLELNFADQWFFEKIEIIFF
jgi:hypothetical protein